MNKLTELVSKQNNESYQLGKKHGAIEELEKVKNEINELKDFNEACCGGSDLGEAIKVIKDRIAELRGENK